MQRITEFVAGLLFGLGLLLSGMSDPGKVLGFLDLLGTWDPSLALVMAGAILVGMLAFTVAKKRHHEFPGRRPAPSHRKSNRSATCHRCLVVRRRGGNWRAFAQARVIVSMFSGQPKATVFVLAMVIGMLLYEAADRWIHQPRAGQAATH
jgi:uncharacterized membrane protein YedE/YeeE